MTGDFDPGLGGQIRTSNGMQDLFLMKFSPDGDFQWVKTAGGPYDDCSDCVAVDAKGEAIIAGRFSGSVDFNPDSGVDIHNSNGDVTFS